jgi:hypothetical protein
MEKVANLKLRRQASVCSYFMTIIPQSIIMSSEVLLGAEVPMILWAEKALIQYGIPATVIASITFDDQLLVYVAR